MASGGVGDHPEGLRIGDWRLEIRGLGWISLSTALDIGFTLLNRNGRIGFNWCRSCVGVLETKDALDLDYISTKEDLDNIDKMTGPKD